MMEYWNVDFQRNRIIYEYFAFIVKLGLLITNFSIFPKPTIPSFQYSNIPIGAKPLSSNKQGGTHGKH